MKKIFSLIVISIILFIYCIGFSRGYTDETYYVNDYDIFTSGCTEYSDYYEDINPDVCYAVDSDLKYIMSPSYDSHFLFDDPLSASERLYDNWTASIRFSPNTIYQEEGRILFGDTTNFEETGFSIIYQTNPSGIINKDVLNFFTGTGAIASKRVYSTYNVTDNLGTYILIDAFYNETDNYIYFFLDGVYQGRGLLDYAFTGTGLTSFYIKNYDLTSTGGINVSIDWVRVQQGYHVNESLEPSLNFYCPLDNCLFYDDFNYPDGDTLTGKMFYTGNLAHLKTYDEKLYIDTGNLSYQPYARHYLLTDIYPKKEFNIKFVMNDTITPSSLETNYMIYDFQVLCENSYTIGLFTAIFSYRPDIQYYGNESFIMQLTTYDNGDLRVLGTFEIKNTETFYLRTQFVDEEQLIYYYYDTQSSLQDGFVPEYIDKSSYLGECSKLQSIRFDRGDVNNNISYGYIGIDRITMQGYYTESYIETEFDTIPFTYTNKTNESQAYIHVDIMEESNNIAYNFGFKSSASRLLFWFGLIILCIAYLIKNTNIDNTVKSFLSIIIMVVGVFIGYKWGFLGKEILIFVVFLVAILGMFALRKFTGSSTAGD